MIDATFAIAAFVAAFLLGSIPNGVIVGKRGYDTDIREVGSGNIGTTNAFRALGKKGGAIVFALDFGKGLLAGLVAFFMGEALCGAGAPADPTSLYTRPDLLAIAFVGCIFGHVFTPWLGFQGGKGVAVAAGALFVAFWPEGAVLESVVFAAIVLSTRYVSAGSIACACVVPFLAGWFYWGDWLAMLLFTLGAVTVVWAHRENIGRLVHGTERRIGDSREGAAQDGEGGAQ